MSKRQKKLNPRRKSERKSQGIKAATRTGQTSEVREPAGRRDSKDRVEIFIGGVPFEIPPELEAAVQRARKGLLQSIPQEMTTTQAAEFLDVSRPFIIKLVERLELPCRRVGKHRRIPMDALMAYREKMFQKGRLALDEMAQLSQDMGLYDEKATPKVP